MEEASIAAVNDELSPVASGITCCRMISACRDLTDYRRATSGSRPPSRTASASPSPGSPASAASTGPRSRRSAARGTRAEQELSGDRRARRLQRDAEPGGRATTRSGTSGACAATSPAPRTALREAHARGRSPQPALALDPPGRRQDRGRAQRRSTPRSPTRLGPLDARRLLPAQVEIAVAAGDSAARGRRSTSSARSSRTTRRLPSRPAAGRAGTGPARGGRWRGGRPGAPDRRSGAGARSGRRTRSREPGRPVLGAPRWSATTRTPTSSSGRARGVPAAGRSG